jgi:hypothetical protein
VIRCGDELFGPLASLVPGDGACRSTIQMTMNESECPKPQPGDLILRTRPGLNTRTGRLESRSWLDTFGSAGRAGSSYETRSDALVAGRQRAEADGIALWEDVTSVTCPTQRVRLEVSFRSP